MATKLPSGMYRAQVYVGTDDTGKRRYESFLADTEDEADFLALSFKLGKTKKKGKKTLREACEEYIETRRGVIAPRTINEYEKVLDKNFARILDLPLDKVNSAELNKEIRKMIAKGNSSKTVENKISFIKSVLKENEILVKTTIPRTIQKEYDVPSPEEFTILHNYLKGKDVELAFLCAAWLSLRAGEIFGLKYSDFDTNNGILHIRRARTTVNGKHLYKTPKTKSGERRIPLPDYISNLVIAHKKQKKASDNDFIYTFVDSYFLNNLKRACRQCELPLYSFHALRHLNASVMALLDIPEVYALKRGGWSSAKVMKGIYTTTFDSKEKAVATSIDDFFATHLATRNATRK